MLPVQPPLPGRVWREAPLCGGRHQPSAGAGGASGRPRQDHLRHGQPHHHLRCRGRLRLRRRLYGDGLHHRLRAAVGPGPLRHQGGGERDPAQRCLSQGHHPAGTGRPDCRRCHLQVPGIHRLYHSAAQHLRPGRHRQHGSGVRGQGGPVRPGRKDRRLLRRGPGGL